MRGLGALAGGGCPLGSRGWPGGWCVPRPGLALAASPRAGQVPSLGSLLGFLPPGKASPDLRPLPFPFIMRPRGRNSSIKNPLPGSPGPPPARGSGCGATRHSPRPLPCGAHSLGGLLPGDWATDDPSEHRVPDLRAGRRAAGLGVRRLGANLPWAERRGRVRRAPGRGQPCLSLTARGG